MKILDYLPAPVGFIALLISIGGPFTWDDSRHGLGQITPLGWATLGLGAGAMLASLILTRRTHKELESQLRQQNQLRAIADSEIRLALKQLTWPFFVLFDDETEGAILELVPPHIDDAERLAAVLEIDVRSNKSTRWSHVDWGGLSWAEVLKLNADKGAARIDRALQIYAAYLAPGILEALSELRTSEFLMRLQRLDEHVEENSSVAFLEFPFSGRLKGGGASRFWTLIRRLDETLVKEAARLTRRL